MRLIEYMRAELRRLNDRASLYRMRGEHSLSDDLRFAISKLDTAIKALEIAHLSEQEARKAA